MNQKTIVKAAGIVLVSAILIYGITAIYIDIRQASFVLNEYPELKRHDEINGKIKSVYNKSVYNMPRSRKIGSFVRLEFDGGFNYMLKAHSMNNDSILLEDVCKAGSVIKKEVGSDTIYVYYSGKIYKFRLEQK